jgi:Cu2+-exporting ATPase
MIDHAAHGPGPTPGGHVTGDRSDQHAAHDRHAGHSVAMFRDRFMLSLLLTVPVVVLSPDIAMWFGYELPASPVVEVAPALLGTAVFLYGGLVFIRGAAAELRDRQPGMMTLISLAIVVAFATSWASTLGFFEVEIWWELATLITIMLLGHWLEMRSIAQARGALSALAELLPDTAERVTGAGVETIELAALAVGDIVLVRPGGRVPADGAVVEGAADVDESMITGESRSVAKEPGDRVVAGTIAVGGSLRVRVDAIGDDTALSGIMRLVAAAQASASRAQALADRAAALLFYVALAAGAITLVAWWILGDPEGALTRTATVLVIACPHALGLAIPLVIAISTSIGARQGLLVKDRLALERARELDTVIFDKTGTLTAGKPQVTDIVTRGIGEREALSLAAALEAGSSHPLAVAILARAKADNVAVPPSSDARAIGGKGVAGRVDGKDILLASPSAAAERVELAASDEDEIARLNEAGKTVSVLIVDGVPAAFIAMRDEPRPDAEDGLRALASAGIGTVMLTGDNPRTGEAIGRRLGIAVRAGLLPEDKQRIVGEMQQQGLVVAKVGDGINDAPALAAADIGIAMGGGTDVALETADAAVLHGRVADVAAMVALSRATMSNIRQNITIALGLKAVFLVTTILGITGLWPAILADTGATVLVTANALRLLAYKPTGAAIPGA